MYALYFKARRMVSILPHWKVTGLEKNSGLTIRRGRAIHSLVGMTTWNGMVIRTLKTRLSISTYLYANWKYSGSGGIWPRVHRGNINGLGHDGKL